MPVRLIVFAAAQGAPRHASWVAIGEVPGDLDPTRRLDGLPRLLEEAFDDIREDWWTLGRELGYGATAWLAHTPTCATNVSDLGLMLAWTRLVEGWAVGSEDVLVVCGDPWLFRHLALLPGVDAGAPPPLWPRALALALRGWLARAAVALRMVSSTLRLKGRRAALGHGESALLVYGHPRSTADGFDAYFGTLMRDLPSLKRALHADCGPAHARALAIDGRTASLHAWGSSFFTPALVFARWQPDRRFRKGPAGWLVRRAAALENAGGGIAMTRWQAHCQRRWLAATRPRVVAWPWENHAWERDFVRAARVLGIKTIGYQHSVIGPQMLNYALASNPDGLASIPDYIFCVGQAARDQLLQWDYPENKLIIAGALRFPEAVAPTPDSSAPVFMALPSGCTAADEMVRAARRASEAGWRFVIKSHPMTPFAFRENGGVRGTDRSLAGQEKVSAVVYAGTTVGLEAILAGIPTLRFQSRSTIALNILPKHIAVPTADSMSLAVALDRLGCPPKVDRGFFFAPVDVDRWRDHLVGA